MSFDARINKICRVCSFLAFLSLLLAFTASLMAQTSSTGALAGTVTDPTSAAIANATVTVTSADTAQVQTATTGPQALTAHPTWGFCRRAITGLNLTRPVFARWKFHPRP